ncbi:MAG: alpha/beta hydrolase-fold protein [Lutibacter sp.]|uniref:alpha/beta hydrolase-fold protein n=1 Tax=Lutibacter sp. TaxID=1925666 RepID=UPI00299F5095|nr:alpha/beta hydrolase-fold protein [Lutibacter sp.]MDX1829815.1 alpha/beta hydrolase-fold protein [Lutibacter sp.]
MKKIILVIILLVTVKFTYSQTKPKYLYKLGAIDSLYSKNLNENRKIFVQFPDSYKPNSDKKYPVAYILDGEILLPTVSNVQSFYSGGYTPEMILIGISNSKNRTRDLTPTKIKTKYGMPFTEENGQAANFYKFIEDELIPYVEKKYPVTNYRTLIGHSFGGLFTIYTLINHPQLFANYLAIDPSLDWDNQKLLKQAKEILAENSFKGKSLYMSLSGQLHMQNPDITINNVMKDTTDYTLFARSNISFSNIVKHNKENGLYFNWEFYPKDIHGTIALPSIRSGLIATFKWFQMEKTDKFNSPDTPKEELYSIVKYRANKLKNHFRYDVPPYPEELINMSGYMSMDMGQLEKAKMFFEFGIKYYPKSPNVYDSMADYYISQKDTKNALKYVTKAYEISGSDYFAKRIKTLKNGI